MTRPMTPSEILTGILGIAGSVLLTYGLVHAFGPTVAPDGPAGTVTASYTRPVCGQRGCSDVGRIIVRHNGGEALITATIAQANTCRVGDHYPTCLQEQK